MKNVLVAIPCKTGMHPKLLKRMQELSSALIGNNDGFEVELAVSTRMFPKGSSIFDAVAAARNDLIERRLKSHHDYVMWLDADLVEYPSDVITQLHVVNPDGVTAPLVLIEGGSAFYDVAAFVESGQPVYGQEPHFGNVMHKPPHFTGKERVIDCDSVGCAFLLPAMYHRNGSRFYATPFTDHYPVIRRAKLEGARVVCARDVVVRHANLPKYSERWHSEDMFQWYDWFERNPSHGFSIKPSRRQDAGNPRKDTGKRRPPA